MVAAPGEVAEEVGHAVDEGARHALPRRRCHLLRLNAVTAIRSRLHARRTFDGGLWVTCQRFHVFLAGLNVLYLRIVFVQPLIPLGTRIRLPTQRVTTGTKITVVTDGRQRIDLSGGINLGCGHA